MVTSSKVHVIMGYRCEVYLNHQQQTPGDILLFTMSQYITLPSNSSMQYFPQNTLTSFNTKLAKAIIHDDSKWEVALAEISFPKSWINVIDGENEIYVEQNSQLKSLTIPVKRYSNNYEFYHAISECLAADYKLGIVVYFIEKTGHMVFESSKGSVVYISGKLALQVGFESDVVLAYKPDIHSALISKHYKFLKHGTRIKPPNPVNVNIGHDILYIYTDCIEQQLVGDVQAQLLRNVCVNNFNSIPIQTSSFESPHYIPVARRDFDTIRINIRDETGRKVPFQFGRVVVKLHFRLRRQSFFQ